MRVRFGFVAMAPALADASPAKTVTATAAARMDPGARLYRLREVARANLANTLRILRHADAHGIRVYRFSSRLIPLATHPLADGWDWADEMAEAFAAIGAFVRAHDMRVSFHPDHYAPLGSPRPEVQAAAERDYAYHSRMVDAMGLCGRVRRVMHVGGGYGDAEAAAERCAATMSRLQGSHETLALENDDRVHDGGAVCALARRVGVPFVLDFHHQRVLRGDGGLAELAAQAAETWQGEVPKFHLSSPAAAEGYAAHSAPAVTSAAEGGHAARSASSFTSAAARPRDHADFIAVPDGEVALDALRAAGIPAADVMIEAKGKDAALFRLVADLGATGRWVPEGEAAVHEAEGPGG